MRRSGCLACTPATACWRVVTAWSTFVTLPGTLNVTRALRPSADTRLAAAASGCAAAYCGRAASDAATWAAACRMAGSVAKVAPGAVAWISTFSAYERVSCAGAYLVQHPLGLPGLAGVVRRQVPASRAPGPP